LGSAVETLVQRDAFFPDEYSSDEEHVSVDPAIEDLPDEGHVDGYLDGFPLFDSSLNLSEISAGPVGNLSLASMMDTDDLSFPRNPERQESGRGINPSNASMDTDQFSLARNPEPGHEMGDHSLGTNDHQEAASDTSSDSDDSSADTDLDESSSFQPLSTSDDSADVEENNFTIDSLLLSLQGGGENEGQGRNDLTIGENGSEGGSDIRSDIMRMSLERRDESMRLSFERSEEGVDEDHDHVSQPFTVVGHPGVVGFQGVLNNVDMDSLQVTAGTRVVRHPGAPPIPTAATHVDHEDQHSMSPIPFVDQPGFHVYEMDAVVRDLMEDFLSGVDDHTQVEMEGVEVAVDPPSVPDLALRHVNSFPNSVSNSGEDNENGTSQLDETILRMDVDSIVHMADCFFSMLKFFG
jgi:hypothetical protein